MKYTNALPTVVGRLLAVSPAVAGGACGQVGSASLGKSDEGRLVAALTYGL